LAAYSHSSAAYWAYSQDTFEATPMDPTDSGFKPLASNTSFLLDLDGHKAVALKLPGNIASEIAGQRGSGGIVERLKSMVGRGSSDRWLILTSPHNPLLRDSRFSTIVAERLTTGLGSEVQPKNLLLSGGAPLPTSQPQVTQPNGP
jgi:hypothetical protein